MKSDNGSVVDAFYKLEHDPSASGVRHVFLIDDDEFIRENLTTTLLDAGYQVHAFANPTEFLQAELQQWPAVILTDMVMPYMTGIELQAELNERASLIPLVFMSAESRVDQSVVAMKQGAIEFLVKPFEKQHLIEAIESGLVTHAKKIKLEQLLSQLTPRERQVFNLLGEGYSNAGLMDALGISLPTAKQYKSEVMRKLSAKSLVDIMNLSK